MDIIEIITELLQAVVPLVAMVLLYHSNPPSKAQFVAALDKAESAAEKTDTPLDDMVVDGGQLLVELLPEDESVNEEIAAA